MRELTADEQRDAVTRAFNAARRRIDADVVAPGCADHDTWNDCPDCGATWRDPQPTPGVLHFETNTADPRR